MNCCDCRYYEASTAARPGGGLEGYGYCRAAPTCEGRAQFFAAARACWLTPPRGQARPS